GQELDGHVALQPLVKGQVDGRHAAHPQAALDAVSPCDCASAHCPFPLPLPAPPPRPAPPLPLVVLLPELAVLVADELVVVGVEVVVGLLVELLVGEEVVLLEVVEELVLVVVLVVVWQSLAASWLTVLTPCTRFRRRVGLTVAWRFPTALFRPETAVA